MFVYSYSNPSGLKTSSSQIMVGPGALSGIDAVAPSSGVVVLTIYDSPDNNTSGRVVLAQVEVDAGMVSVNHEFTTPVGVNQGIYVEATGTGIANNYSYIVRFLRG